MKRLLKRAYRAVVPEPTIGQKLARFAQQNPSLPSRPGHFVDQIEIIIPCYNHADSLPRAFASILSQTWDKYPLAVTFIDDHSSDGTPEVIKTLMAAKHPRKLRLKSLRNSTNLRQWASINKAVAASSNSLFIILNDDDLLTADCIEKIVFALTNNPTLFMVGGSSIWFNQLPLPKHDQIPSDKLELAIYQPEQTAAYTQLNDLNMTHSSTAFFKTAWETAGGYRDKPDRVDPSCNEDRDFQMRVNSLMPVGVYTDYPLAYWSTDTSHGKDY